MPRSRSRSGCPCFKVRGSGQSVAARDPNRVIGPTSGTFSGICKIPCRAQASCRTLPGHARPGPRAQHPRPPARDLRQAAPPHRQGLDELILTVLSQWTSDRNRDVAYLRLRRRFPTWQAVPDAQNEEVEEAIRPGGIANIKSQGIQAVLRALPATLDGSAPDESPRVPVSLPGVGRKTAACVLLFAYGRRDVPVDTHVSRVGTRLGLFRPKASFEEMHDEMLAFTPRGQELELHVNLLRHGRRTCHARRPGL